MFSSRQPEPEEQDEAKLVRLHLLNDEASFEGILVGDLAGHYRLLNASVLHEEDGAVKMEGEAWVPRERVLFVQVIG